MRTFNAKQNEGLFKEPVNQGYVKAVSKKDFSKTIMK